MMLVLLGAASGARGDQDHQFSATLGCGPFYPVRGWAPVSLNLRNNSDKDADGYVLIPAGGDMGATTRQPVFVAAHSVQRLMTAAYFYGPPDFDRRKAGSGAISAPEWYTNDGARLDRTEFFANRQDPRASGVSAAGGTVLLSVNTLNLDSQAPSKQEDGLSRMIETLGGSACTVFGTAGDEVPRTTLGFSPFAYTLFTATPPDDLDAAQRAALMARVTGGGTLVICAPPAAADPSDSWLAPYLPVRIVGRRQGNWIKPIDPSINAPVKPINLIETCDLVEAVELPGAATSAGGGGGGGGSAAGDDVTVVLRDANYVHAAVRRVGLGRVVFTSFPVSALDPRDGRTQTVWRRLLGIRDASAAVSAMGGLQAPPKREDLMNSLLGRPAPRWGLAAGVAGGYVLAVVAVQLLIGGVRRPAGFAVVAALAVVGFGGLLLATQLTRGKDPVVGGRLGSVRLGPGGGGVRSEDIAFIGQNQPDFALMAAGGTATSPVIAGPVRHDQPPTIIPVPFASPDAGVKAADLERIWQAQGVVDRKTSLRAVGTFGPGGLNLAVENGVGGPLAAPSLVWGASIFSLGDAPEGASTAAATLAQLNAPGPNQYTHGSGIVSEADKLRGRFLQSELADAPLTPALEPAEITPLLVGWLPPQAMPPLLSGSDGVPPPSRGDTMVRVPVRVAPSPVGSTVHLDPPFTRLVRTAGAAGLPMDVTGTVASNLPGAWVVAVATPTGIGRLKPTHVVVAVDCDCPRQVVTLRAGQAPGGVQPERGDVETAPPLAVWNQPIHTQRVEFDVGPNDVTAAEGQVLLWLGVENLTTAGGALPRWTIHAIAVTVDATVVGPPVPEALTAEYVEPPPTTQFTTAPTTAKAPAAKAPAKPKAKPTTKKAKTDDELRSNDK